MAEGRPKEITVNEWWMGCSGKEEAEHDRKLKIRQGVKMSG